MKNTILSYTFHQMADIMEILGEDRFRINSYRKVGRVIGDIPTDIEMLLATGALAKTPGIGKSSLAKIEEFIKTDAIKAHQELLKKIPPKLLELLQVPGMGPKGVKAVYDKLNVKSIAELKGAIKNGSFAKLPGFGDKKAAAIIRGIEFLEKSTGRIRLDEAMGAAYIVTDLLRELAGIQRIQTAGSLRRRTETIGDVDILVSAGKSKKASERIVEGFTSAEFVEEVLASGPTKGSAIIRTETAPVQVDVRAVPKESFGAAAQYFTGSKEHNVRLREIAIKAGFKLNEYGLFKGEKTVAGQDEEEIYQKLKLAYIEPVLREDRGEIEAAKTNSLPELIQIGDVKGDFHMHTKASDGRCEMSEMVEAAKEIGYEYICITDHSQSSAIANGLSAKQLAAQIKQIHKLNENIKSITILAGSEVDILADGSVDFDNKLLAELDFVIASIHSGMASPSEKVTNRTLKAMDNPYVNCIGHPTGRLIGQREAMDIDMAAVIKHAAQTQTAFEVNANPWRLDLKDIHCRMAIESGVKLVIGTDAHSVGGLGLMGFGVATAARGWATKDDVLNTLTASKIKSWVKSKRSG
ncbi:MAG: DNA polymerase/3'-5' exonuclease PolX [Planctomycetes bacterium]|nr:DNA polymerase/3'-5' exonuclease PolX [Planctomycetota bacterium]